MRNLGSYVARHHWGLIATFIALGGTAYASGVLPAHSVGTRQLKRGAVGTAQLRRGAVGTAQLKHGAVTLSQISSGAQSGLQYHPPTEPAPTPANNYFFAHAFGVWGGNASYYRDTRGVVHLAGQVHSSPIGGGPTGPPPSANLCERDSTGHGLPIFYLPASNSPSITHTFAVASGDGIGIVEVTSDGAVRCAVGSGDQSVSLDGITFRAGG